MLLRAAARARVLRVRRLPRATPLPAPEGRPRAVRRCRGRRAHVHAARLAVRACDRPVPYLRRPAAVLGASRGRGGTVRVGVQLPEAERVVRWPEYLAMARAAEEAYFESIWLGDHLLYRGDGREERGPLEVWTLLSAIAAVTERATIGPLVACTSFHPPGLIAKMAATVDDVSRGRLVLGLGAGWNETEYRAFGLPYDHRVSRFEESFSIIRRILAGERITAAGRYWSAEDLVLMPPPERRIPLMIGSFGERMLSITLPHVDWWNTWYSSYGNTRSEEY